MEMKRNMKGIECETFDKVSLIGVLDGTIIYGGWKDSIRSVKGLPFGFEIIIVCFQGTASGGIAIGGWIEIYR